MAKDAKGHGSEKRGAPTKQTVGGHQVGVLALGRAQPKPPRLETGQGPIFKVQALDASRNLVGPYRTTKAVDSSPKSQRPSAKAETIAKGLRVDNPDTLFRVRTSGNQGPPVGRRR